jgi:hypothetical protein
MPQEWSDSPTTELRVEVADVDADGKAREWATWLPYYFISPLATGGTLLEGPATPDGFPIRLVVRPTQGEEILLDQARRDARFALPESLLKAAPRLKYKFMRYDHDQKKWVDACGYVILKTSQVPAQSSGATISSTWQPNETKSLAAPFLFTVDVEVNLRSNVCRMSTRPSMSRSLGLHPRAAPRSTEYLTSWMPLKNTA